MFGKQELRNTIASLQDELEKAYKETEEYKRIALAHEEGERALQHEVNRLKAEVERLNTQLEAEQGNKATAKLIDEWYNGGEGDIYNEIFGDGRIEE